MNRLRSTRLLCMVIAVVVVGARCPARSWASGGSAWKMTLNNPTRWSCTVEFYYGGSFDRKDITPGGRMIFNVPLAGCPAGFTGHIDLADGRTVKIRSANCLGNEVSGSPIRNCCWDVEFDICLKAGTADAPDQDVHDDDYGFCKK